MTNRFLIIARVINVGSAVNRLSLLLQKKNGNENEMNENEQAFRERKVDRGSRLVNNDYRRMDSCDLQERIWFTAGAGTRCMSLLSPPPNLSSYR